MMFVVDFDQNVITHIDPFQPEEKYSDAFRSNERLKVLIKESTLHLLLRVLLKM